MSEPADVVRGAKDALDAATRLLAAAEKSRVRKQRLRAYREAHALCADCGGPVKDHATCQRCRVKRSQRRHSA